MRFFTSLLLIGLWPAAAAAQSGPSLGADGTVGASAGVTAGLGTVKGSVVPVARGGAGVDLLPWLRIGGEGAIPLQAVRVSGTDATDRTELRIGYGGVRLDLRRRAEGMEDRWRVGLLLAAGTARVRSGFFGTDLATENFFAVEPVIHRTLGARGPFSLGGSLAYRFPFGVGGLPGVQRRDLGGATVGFTVEVARPP